MIRRLLDAVKSFVNKVRLGQLRVGYIASLALGANQELIMGYEYRIQDLETNIQQNYIQGGQ